jgi:hypothetical protein
MDRIISFVKNSNPILVALVLIPLSMALAWAMLILSYLLAPLMITLIIGTLIYVIIYIAREEDMKSSK